MQKYQLEYKNFESKKAPHLELWCFFVLCDTKEYKACCKMKEGINGYNVKSRLKCQKNLYNKHK